MNNESKPVRLSINIDVNDLEKAIEFYRGGLGLRLARRLFGGTVAEMGGSTSPIYLLEKKSGSLSSVGSSQVRTYTRHWTPVHLDFVVDDLDVALERALAAGARPEGESQTFNWGRLATMSDPFGHGLCLVQWLGKGYDEAS